MACRLRDARVGPETPSVKRERIEIEAVAMGAQDGLALGVTE